MTSETDIREATATIRGYLYQFDATIYSILHMHDQGTLTIEGIEDFDIGNANLSELFQCKYYSSQRLTNSTIRDAILPMMRSYVSADQAARAKLRFHLYGYFKDSQPEERIISAHKLKEILIRRQRANSSSHSRKMKVIDVQSELKASDDDIAAFAGLLKIHICEEYDNHKLKSIFSLKKHFGVTQLEVEAFLYPSAMTFISNLAANPDRAARQISKELFTKQISPSRSLYNVWTLREKGANGYCAALRRTHFSAQNIDAINRFFVVEALKGSSESEILTLCHVLRKKWSSYSVRRKPDSERYAPFIYFKGLSFERLVKLKTSLQRDDVSFVDGYPFLGADFNMEHLCSCQTFQNQISLRILHSDESLHEVITSLKGRQCVYEFFFEKPILSDLPCAHVSIPVTSISMISNIV
jgi:hypothetical protein